MPLQPSDFTLTTGNELTSLTVSGKPFNSLAAAYASLSSPQDREELDNFLLTQWAVHYQRAETGVQDRESERNTKLAAQIVDLQEQLEEQKTKADVQIAALTEDIRVLRLPSGEQVKAQAAAKLAELDAQRAQLQAILDTPAA